MKLQAIIILIAGILLQSNTNAQKIYSDTIPIGGNAWVKEPATITDDGLTNWTDAASVASIYFRTDQIQNVQIALRLKVPEGVSEIEVRSGKSHFNKIISGKDFETVEMGKISVTATGYNSINITGISKTGKVYAEITDLIIQYEKPDSGLAYVKSGSSFHFGRRGPSVHLNFSVPDELSNKVFWFYNEITVPTGMDKLGSYFEANGFGEGYFGMQVNSETERRILFSVWSPFETQNPKDIPDSLKIILLQKGAAVETHEFGDEGSGGQSFLKFPWKSGKTYGFLLHAEPDSFHRTTGFTAYFKDLRANKWYLIACFKRPQTVTSLKHLYSFLENFIPETGNETRMGYYSNQWMADREGNWQELREATFTVDATAKAGFRKDYAGGAAGDKFYLKNAGFFNEFTRPGQKFSRASSHKKPAIDFSKLPH